MTDCATNHQCDAEKVRGDRSWLRPVMVAVLVVQAAAASAALAIESHAPAHTAVAGTLDHRVAVLTKALDLDARQQAELRRIFAHQRESVRKIWRDPDLLAAERAPATRAVEERTADEIRLILNDAQKKRYNPPKPQAAPSAPPDVAAWMETARAGQR